jgi:arsenate reductase
MKQRVLFLCIGNSCRSQMAEGFARVYGHDVIDVVSAGLSPAMLVDLNTKAVMEERGVSLEKQFPKTLEEALTPVPNLLINMSGSNVPHFASEIPAEVWRVRDPVGEMQGVHREVRDQVEGLVMNLILRLRQRLGRPAPAAEEKPKRIKFGRMV